eukprot:TRINITY_DN2494_c0_g1_i1.p1 TRINITY_DN2494_c0_g1~~TRINITY_DN2494_c0_g1_i1.p1  ORF type:complete len:569 (+),score=87.89 TRINITY_DN2494_c0_g1_i1:69-1775(+)
MAGADDTYRAEGVGCEGICFEPDGEQRSMNWQETGQGKGAYEKVQTYKYVGENKGHYDKEAVVTYSGWRCRWICMFLLLLLLLAGLAVLLWLFFIPETKEAEIKSLAPAHHTVPFDCEAGYWNWEKGWSTSKKHYCCDKEGRGCPKRRKDLPYDCTAGFYNWRAGWSMAKKQWCCRHEDRGCPTIVHPSSPYDCHAGPVHTWTEGKQLWCCHMYRTGCPHSHAIVHTEAYDCDAGNSNWQKGWSEAKKDWCCHHHRRGCAPERFVETVEPKYDCEAGYENWRHGWTPEKKSWCCHHVGKGCRTLEHVRIVHVPYDCNAGYTNWKAGWSDDKKAWCCEYKDMGCMHKSEPYDCESGLSNWKAGWSHSKKIWCCSKAGHGCETAVGCDAACEFKGEAHSCKDRILWAARNHFANKGDACSRARDNVTEQCDACSSCSLEQAECLDHGTSESHNCEADLESWKHTWSDAKKAWCCTHQDLGCESATQIGDHGFDCNAGYSNWAAGWSNAKKEYCCDREKRACTGHSPPSMPAPSGKVWKRVIYGGGMSWQLVAIHGEHGETLSVHHSHDVE